MEVGTRPTRIAHAGFWESPYAILCAFGRPREVQQEVNFSGCFKQRTWHAVPVPRDEAQ